jgi:hypothetical protein
MPFLLEVEVGDVLLDLVSPGRGRNDLQPPDHVVVVVDRSKVWIDGKLLARPRLHVFIENGRC